MKKINWKKLIIILLLTFIIGTLPSWFLNMNLEGLDTPFYIPKIIFPIVWSILYILMSISYYLVSDEKDTLGIYSLQLIFNSVWSIIFFGFKFRFLAFIWLIILFIEVLIMFLKYIKINKISGYLLIPYLIWLVIAGYLNISIFILN